MKYTILDILHELRIEIKQKLCRNLNDKVLELITRKEQEKPMTITRESVVENGLCNLVKSLSWEIYSNNLETDAKTILLNSGYNLEEINMALKVNNSWFNKCYRIKKRIIKMENEKQKDNLKMFFATFTFNDETLKKNSKESLKTYVRRFLKDYCIDYLANVEYGKKNGRIHFHAVCIAKDVLPYNIWYEEHKYGALVVEHCRFDEKTTEKRLSKYINKLSLHAIKDTTGMKRIITCRRSTRRAY